MFCQINADRAGEMSPESKILFSYIGRGSIFTRQPDILGESTGHHVEGHH